MGRGGATLSKGDGNLAFGDTTGDRDVQEDHARRGSLMTHRVAADEAGWAGRATMGARSREASAWALLDLLESCGQDVDEVASMLGLQGGESRPFDFLTVEQHFRLWDLAIEMTGDPALGLHLPDRMTASGKVHFLVPLTASAPTLRSAFALIERFSVLLSDVERHEVHEEGDALVLVHAYTCPSYHRSQLELFGFYACETARRILGPGTRPSRIEVRYPDPGYADEMAALLGTPVTFSARREALYFPLELADRPAVRPNPFLHRALLDHAASTLTAIRPSALLTDRVRLRVTEGLPLGTADAESVARELGMTRRTLHRHLLEEGTTFRALLDETRRSLAGAHLRLGKNVAETADLLGFTTPSAFNRAFKRWYGEPPSRWRG